MLRQPRAGLQKLGRHEHTRRLVQQQQHLRHGQGAGHGQGQEDLGTARAHGTAKSVTIVGHASEDGAGPGVADGEQRQEQRGRQVEFAVDAEAAGLAGVLQPAPGEGSTSVLTVRLGGELPVVLQVAQALEAQRAAQGVQEGPESPGRVQEAALRAEDAGAAQGMEGPLGMEVPARVQEEVAEAALGLEDAEGVQVVAAGAGAEATVDGAAAAPLSPLALARGSDDGEAASPFEAGGAVIGGDALQLPTAIACVAEAGAAGGQEGCGGAYTASEACLQQELSGVYAVSSAPALESVFGLGPGEGPVAVPHSRSPARWVRGKAAGLHRALAEQQGQSYSSVQYDISGIGNALTTAQAGGLGAASRSSRPTLGPELSRASSLPYLGSPAPLLAMGGGGDGGASGSRNPSKTQLIAASNPYLRGSVVATATATLTPLTHRKLVGVGPSRKDVLAAAPAAALADADAGTAAGSGGGGGGGSAGGATSGRRSCELPSCAATHRSLKSMRARASTMDLDPMPHPSAHAGAAEPSNSTPTADSDDEPTATPKSRKYGVFVHASISHGQEPSSPALSTYHPTPPANPHSPGRPSPCPGPPAADPPGEQGGAGYPGSPPGSPGLPAWLPSPTGGVSRLQRSQVRAWSCDRCHASYE